jgi:hypothetical protein
MSGWVLPEDIDGDKHFRIDPIMRDSVGQTKFSATFSPEAFVKLGRRTLEYAIVRAIGNPIDLSAMRKDWQQLVRLTESTSAHLNALIQNLAPFAKGVDHSEQRRLVAIPLMSMITPRDLSGENANVRNIEIRQIANDRAEALLAAKSALLSIATNARDKDRFVAEQNVNKGAESQNDLVEVFAETWIAITGSLPSSNKSDRFMDFLIAGWTDAGQKRANFTRCTSGNVSGNGGRIYSSAQGRQHGSQTDLGEIVRP